MAIVSKLFFTAAVCAALLTSNADAKTACVEGNRVKVRFDFDWPNAPEGAKMGRIVCALHSAQYSMWSGPQNDNGKVASLGLATLAATNSVGTLVSELKASAFAYTTSPAWSTNAHGDDSEYSTYLTLTGSGIQYVSCAVKLLESPDWFVGLHNAQVCNAANEMESVGKRKLVAWDAGVREGTQHKPSTIVTSPAATVDYGAPDSVEKKYGKVWVNVIEVNELCEAGNKVTVRFDFNWPSSSATDSFGKIVCALTKTAATGIWQTNSMASANLLSALSGSTTGLVNAIEADTSAVVDATATGYAATGQYESVLTFKEVTTDLYLSCAASGPGANGMIGIPARKVCNGMNADGTFNPIITPTEAQNIALYNSGVRAIANVNIYKPAVTTSVHESYGTMSIVGSAAPALSAVLAAAVAMVAALAL